MRASCKTVVGSELHGAESRFAAAISGAGGLDNPIWSQSAALNVTEMHLAAIALTQLGRNLYTLHFTPERSGTEELQVAWAKRHWSEWMEASVADCRWKLA